ncbi:helix-turn-helix domain-containing protein [Stenotrophomonas sp. LARHCG68]
MSQHFSWQAAVTKSDLASSTKLVLLVIGTYMNQHGEGALPSYKRLASYASLNRATVIRHVELAVEQGWLTRGADGVSRGDTWRIAAAACELEAKA